MKSLPQTLGLSLLIAMLAATATMAEPPAATVPADATSKVVWERRYSQLDSLIERYVATSDVAQRQAMIKEIQQAQQQLEDAIKTCGVSDAEKTAMKVKSMTVLGKIQLLGNDEAAAVKAILTLEKANSLLHGLKAEARSYELMYLLARAYCATRQTGRAKDLLYQVAEAVPDFAPARLLLTQLLLNDHDSEVALIQIGALDKIAPDDPDVRRLKLACYGMLDRKKYDPLILAELKRIPEKAHADLIGKASTCITLGYPDMALELLERARQQEPADIATIQLLVQIHLARKDQVAKGKEIAIDIVRKAMAADPSNDTLGIMLLELTGAPADQLLKAQEAVLEKTPNGLERELVLFKFHQEHGKFDEAMADLASAEKIKNDDPRVLDLRFQLCLTNKQWKQARQSATKLAELNADQAGGQIYMFRLAMAQGAADKGGIDEALKIASQMVNDLPEFSRSWLSLGQVQQARGEFEPALRSYTAALQKQNGNVDAFRGIIECYYAMGMPDDACRYIKEGLRGQPDNGYFQEQEIVYQLNYGDPSKAVPYRVRQRDANVDSLDAWLNLIAAYFQVAQVALNPSAPNPQAAGDALRLARDACAEAVKKWPDERIVYGWQADVAVLANSYADGVNALQDLSRRPSQKDTPEAMLMLANYYQRFGKIAEAEETFKTVLARTEKNEGVISQMAVFYVVQKRIDDAVKLLSSVPDNRMLQRKLVEILVQTGRLAEAETELNKLLAAMPGDSQLQAVLGFVYMNTNRPERALAALNLALAADPGNGKALFWRGYLHLARQQPPDYDQAIKDLTAAKALDKRDSTLRMMLADALKQSNRSDDAIKELEGAWHLLPDNKDMRLKLVELYGNAQPPRWADAVRVLDEAIDSPAGKTDPDWLRCKAKMWMMRNEADKAVAAITQAMQIGQGNVQVLQDYLTILLQARKYEPLRATCSALLQDPRRAQQEWWIWQLRAIANRNLDQKDQAMIDYDQAFRVATALGNDDAVATVIQSLSETIGVDDAIRRAVAKAQNGDNHWKMILAYLYFSKGDASKAVAMIDGVLAGTGAMAKAEVDAAQTLGGNIYMSARKYEKARKIYADMLERNPADMVANNNMCLLTGELCAQPDFPTALDYSAKAYKAMTQRGAVDAGVLDTYGWTKCLAGQAAEGIKYLQDAVARQPSVERHYHLGEALLMLSPPQAPAALAALTKAREAVPAEAAKGRKIDAVLSNKIDAAMDKATWIKEKGQQ